MEVPGLSAKNKVVLSAEMVKLQNAIDGGVSQRPTNSHAES
jgi:hypothetical protein